MRKKLPVQVRKFRFWRSGVYDDSINVSKEKKEPGGKNDEKNCTAL